MKKSTKKELLLDCTMKAVAENGLMNVSMQMITKMANTAEGLIYKHYQTKENLLLQCYLSVYEDLKAHIETDINKVEVTNKEEMINSLHNLWKKYFKFLIKNREKTLFFYEYRNSSYMYQATANGLVDTKNTFSELANFFYSLDKKFNILQKSDLKSFFVYVTDITIIFAIRLINSKIEVNKETTEMLWNLVWHGQSWLIDA